MARHKDFAGIPTGHIASAQEKLDAALLEIETLKSVDVKTVGPAMIPPMPNSWTQRIVAITGLVIACGGGGFITQLSGVFSEDATTALKECKEAIDSLNEERAITQLTLTVHSEQIRMGAELSAQLNKGAPNSTHPYSPHHFEADPASGVRIPHYITKAEYPDLKKLLAGLSR